MEGHAACITDVMFVDRLVQMWVKACVIAHTSIAAV